MAYLSFRHLQSGTSREFEAGEIRLGRDPDCDWVMTGEGSDVVSGYHARVFLRDDRWWVEDAGSRNGTTLNEQHVSHDQPRALNPGAVLRLGERGPRLRVEAIERSKVADTVIEPVGAARPSAPTLPMDGVGEATVPVASVSGPKAPAANVMQIVLHDTRSGTKYEAKGGRIRLGRGHECELRPVAAGDTSVSRIHAEIVLTPAGKAVLRDAKSRNGTYVDGKLLVGDHVLHPGERITLGDKGPDLVVDVLSVPGSAQRVSDKSTARTVPDTGGDGRRSYAGLGKTRFFGEMLDRSARRGARMVRRTIWSFVAVLAATVAVFVWYAANRERVTAAWVAEQRQAMLEQQAREDSVRQVAAADFERLRRQLDSARLSAAPSAVVDSLRQAFASASRRTEALEGALRRAQEQMAAQVAAGDSIRKAATAEMGRLRAQLTRAADDGSTALLDSLRAAMREAERKTQAVDAQMRGLRGVNLPALAQAVSGAVGLVTAFSGQDVFDGSGFVVTKSGYFVTNRHVVEPEGKPADSLFVTMTNQKFMVRADLETVAPADGPDVAVIRIRNYRGPVVPHVDWTGTHVRQGEPAALIGFPAGASLALDASGRVQSSMSAGIFSKVTPERIQFDGFTVGGSSGSPVFNADAEVVALHRSGLKEAAGLGFAVPIPQLVPYLPTEIRSELGLR